MIIASSSLIFAFIAFRQVMATTGVVGAFIIRANKFLNKFEASAKGLFTPAFVAETIERTVTSGLENEDGSQVTMPQYIAGWANAKGPAMWQDIKKEIPSYIPLLLHENPPPKGAPQNRQANGQWGGSGGLTAAKNVAKAAKKLPLAGKVGEVIETGQAIVGMVGPIKELISEVRGLKGGGGNGDDSGTTPSSSSEDGAMTEWGPPF